MSKLVISAALALAATTMLAGTPALAQKSKDTVRSSSLEPISIVDRIFNAQPSTTLMTSVIQDPLIAYDPVERQFKPALAKSWKLIDDATIEVELRDDIVFHDGSKFDADDVVDIVNLVIDPAVKFRFKENRYGFLKGIEKIGPHKVRVMAKGPTATLVYRLSNNLLMVPGDKLVAQKENFGRNPVGTGPYRVTQVDSTKGVVMVKYDKFQLAAPYRPAAKIGRVEIASTPDMQTQTARLMTGEQDLMFNVNVDQAVELAKNPQFKLFVNDVPSFSYIQFDVANRSGINVLKDQRVRQAISMAINRQKMKENLLPKEAADIPMPSGACHPWLIACKYSAKLPDYNPQRAKVLLREAGLDGGFDINLTAWGAVKDVATAVSGDLRAIGIRANVDYVTYAVYTKKRQDGQLQVLISYYDNGGAQPDAEGTINFFYLPSERDYFQDGELHGLAKQAMSQTDVNQRSATYQKVFDTTVQKNYLMPLLPVPSIVIHNKDLVIEPNQKSPEGFYYNYLRWAN